LCRPTTARGRRRGVEAGGLPIPDWSVDAALAVMDERKVRTSIVSVSTPGVHFGDDHEARDMARAVNEYAANVARKHPDRFGFFATLTLPDVEGSLAELAYAFDTLRADGVVLLANTHGECLGAEAQAPLFDELNRRSAAIFVHPAQLPGPAAPGVPPYAVDFLLDTTRAATRLMQSGTMKRCPNIQVILSHAGDPVRRRQPDQCRHFRRLHDAAREELGLESRFDLAYNATRALALAALRYRGYRSQSRYLVVQCLQHTIDASQQQ
jgi:predicted TIM-barrel fold metal-dependent hydrolase